jgi:hypothetical protein
MSEIKFLNKFDAPATMPEVLTETQQAFADFVTRNTISTDEQYVDAYDIQSGRINLASQDSQLIPIDTLTIHSEYRVEDSDAGFEPVTVLERTVGFESPFVRELPSLEYGALRGWIARDQETGIYDDVSEEYARRVVNGLLSLEAAGELKPIDN